jgi:hypothetical protein
MTNKQNVPPIWHSPNQNIKKSHTWITKETLPSRTLPLPPIHTLQPQPETAKENVTIFFAVS